MPNQQKPASPLVLAIDQSYTRMGVAVVSRDKVYEAFSVKLDNLTTYTQRRNAARGVVQQYILKYAGYGTPFRCIVVERVRLFAGKYLTANTALPLAAMTAGIVDTAQVISLHRAPIPVVSVDTHAWKKAVLENHRASKADAVDYIRTHFEGLQVDHDAADAACMGLYAFRKVAKFKLEK